MSTLHTFGCSITQGFALPDVVKPALDDKGKPLTNQQIIQQGIHWTDIHLYQPSQLAWPQQLGNRLSMPVVNHARRGACFQQIARQCTQAMPTITSEDVVIVMWTYMSRLSLQWPARTSVPFCNVVDPSWGWRTVIKGMNNLFGLSPTNNSTNTHEQQFQNYIEKATKHTYLDPMGVYNRYYNNMVLAQLCDSSLQGTGARVIHLSVEPDSHQRQLEEARDDLHISMKQDYTAIPNPKEWYKLKVDHAVCDVILDPSIPPAENDMHPSQTHHSNFADAVYRRYFGSD
jgi:hypothetical protein